LHIRSLLLILLATSCCLAANKQATADYRSLSLRAKSGDQTVDFRDLRLAYADSEDYENAPDTESQKEAMWAALKEHNYKDAITNADVVLAANFVDIDAHFVEYVAHEGLGEAGTSNLHKFIFRGLIKSITESGDGRTPETAFQVIEVHEEYVVLRSMGVGLPKSQSLMKRGGHSYDAITFDDPDTKKEVTLYFNVDIPAKHGL
jgi:hypothetical protein